MLTVGTPLAILGLALFLWLVWLRGRRAADLKSDSKFERFSPKHYCYFPQIQQALSAEDAAARERIL